MGGCSAGYCSNHSRNGFRMFRFPRDEERRKLWAIKCRRANWIPSSQAQICSAHFEESQYENYREGKKKLKRSAIPTIFDVPSRPKSLLDKMKKEVGLPRSSTILDEKENVSRVDLLKRIDTLEKENDELLKKIECLERENKKLKEEKQKSLLQGFSDSNSVIYYLLDGSSL